MPDREEILSFISEFAKARETFMTGCCYWFARILQERFCGGEILYDYKYNHFMVQLGDQIYDAQGDVTEKYMGSPDLVLWSEYQQIDPSHYKRIVRDCILKKPIEEEK